MEHNERAERDGYLFCLAACVALVACLRLCLALFFPEQIPLGWRLERVVLGTLLDCGPLFVFSLAALFWKTRLMNILSGFWLLTILFWNAANCFLIHTARRIIDYDILLQVLPEAPHALDALPKYGIVVVLVGAARSGCVAEIRHSCCPRGRGGCYRADRLVDQKPAALYPAAVQTRSGGDFAAAYLLVRIGHRLLLRHTL